MKKQIFTLCISFIINLFCFHSFSQAPNVEVTGMTASASNSDNGAASNAIDGNTSTSWTTATGATGQWLQLSLPGTYTLAAVVISGSPFYCNCKVEFWNGYTLVQTVTPSSNTVVPPTSPVNMIKINVDACSRSSSATIDEVKVFRYTTEATYDKINATSGLFSNSIGIGTDSPQNLLHIKSVNNNPYIRLEKQSNSYESGLVFTTLNNPDFYIFTDNSDQ